MEGKDPFVISCVVFLKTLDKTRGAWTDKNHPDLETDKDLDRYVRDKRKFYSKRLA